MKGGNSDVESVASDLFDLLDFGEQMAWQNLRRRYPEESEEELRRRLDEWYLERPGAERGDAGPPPFFRSRRPS